MQQVQVLIDRALTELGLEIDSRLVTLELAVVLQSGWAELADIAVDVLRGLLAADIEGVAQVIGRQPSLPLRDCKKICVTGILTNLLKGQQNAIIRRTHRPTAGGLLQP